jgi:hypothetical protein
MPLPDICVQDIYTCPNERPVIALHQYTNETVTVQIRDEKGDPYVLSDTDNRVFLVVKTDYGTKEPVINTELSITDAAEGRTELHMKSIDLRFAGLYIGELVVYDTTFDITGSSTSSSSGPSSQILEQQAVLRQFVYVEVQENMTHIEGTRIRTISIPEIRLAIRDKCSVDNFLLDKVEFTDTEIAWAIRRPIDYWNDTPPLLKRFTYNASNFPYRYYWVEGTIAELLRVAGLNYERNDLRYSAAGLSVEDKRKAEFYLGVGDKVMNAYKNWVRMTKVSLNMTQAYSTNNIASFGNRSTGITSSFNTLF